jgi:hypothetical protein
MKITDPVSFLRNLVAKKGKSELDGVYLTSVHVVADATENYGYVMAYDQLDRVVSLIFRRDENDWNRLLVDSRLHESEIVHPIAFHHNGEPVTIFFIAEGHEMSCMVCLPKLLIDEFPQEVLIFQQLLKEVSSFAGKTATIVKFALGAVWVSWDELVERGEAQEVDVGF